MWSKFLIMVFSESLKKNKDFVTVYKFGRSKVNKLLIMNIYHNHSTKNRIGISCSKKVGNSIVRHHLTRLIRESYRLNEAMFNSGLDIVVVVREDAKNASFHEIEAALLHLAKLHKITVTGE